MTRAHPADLRDAMIMAQAFIKAGILFVPVPVLNAEDAKKLGQMATDRLDQLENPAKAIAVGQEAV